jgi:Bacterial Ig-like domain (group 3)
MVTFKTKVSSSLQGRPTPTGTVTFMAGTNVLGNVPLLNGQASLSSSGLTVGSHKIVAKYSGDQNFNPNTSAALSQIVNP